ncbi:hypothetical protein [Candidatus Uabimicrobium amorphum]|uniref:ABC transporter permease n=1 Tax=Uabimicrobium amorphum TaxID=2596890 RepID=A0A5S9F1S2_UABAM|nr:hypothetical protein [Candidatus Uabimicrobium amorphum]BBM82866.1 ABC transporter permease [Candidatus Uabimicrobium amorphum]
MPTVIFLRDLKRITSMKYFYWRRFLFVGCIFFFFCVAIASSHTNTAMGVHLLSFIAWATYVLLVLSASASAAMTIGEEIEKKTLGILVITHLSYRNIVVGKYIQQLFITCLNAIAPLPIFLFCISLGGVSLEQIVCILLSLLSTLLIAIAIGIFCSTLFNSKSSGSTAVTLMIVYQIAASYFFYLPISCFHSLRASIAGLDFSYCYYNFFWQCLFSAILVALAVRFLPFMYLWRNKVGFEVKINKALGKIALPSTKKKSKGKVVGQKIKGNPIAWRDFHMIHGGISGNVKKVILVMIIAFFLFLSFTNNSPRRFMQMMPSFLVILMLLFLMTFINSAIRCFSKEMESKSWQILLTTQLTNEQIVQGKMWGAFRSAKIFLMAYLIVLISYALIVFLSLPIKLSQIILSLSYIVWIVAYVANLFCCALFCSFYYKNHRRASNYFVLYFIIWHIMSGMLFSSQAIFWFGFTGVIINLIVAFLHMSVAMTFYNYLVRNLRLRIDFAN